MIALPEGVPGKTHQDLTLLHVSSNQLESLPLSISRCASLQAIYANGNKIQRLPETFGHKDSLQNLESCNLSNNSIGTLSPEFLERFGTPDSTTGKCSKVKRSQI